MGWTYTKQPREGWKNYMNAMCTWESDGVKRRVLDSAIVHRRTYYAAMEITGPGKEREVIAVVCLLDYRPKDRQPFGYKTMDESVGPNECACPERIFKLLTPTEHEYAKSWRERVKAVYAMRKRLRGLKIGQLLAYLDKQYRVCQVKPRVLAEGENGVTYHFKKSVLEDCQLVKG